MYICVRVRMCVIGVGKKKRDKGWAVLLSADTSATAYFDTHTHTHTHKCFNTRLILPSSFFLQAFDSVDCVWMCVCVCV